MVTLYFEVELSRDKRPGTEQNRSVGLTTQVPPTNQKNMLEQGKPHIACFDKFSHEEQFCCLLVVVFVGFVWVFGVFWGGGFGFGFVFNYCITLLL